jgi:glycerate 2-kinase
MCGRSGSAAIRSSAAEGVNPRELLEASFRAALAATDPGRLTEKHLPDTPPDAVIAVGKAAPAMLRAVLERFPGVPSLLIAPPGLDVAGVAATRKVQAGHPVPNENSVLAANEALSLASGLTDGQRLLVLVSGGGSALMSAPWGVTLAQKQALTSALLASGASIGGLNTVRKHLSRVKGGRLAAATQARVTSLLLSDVVGDDPATIASGPTVADPGTFADALKVLDRYSLHAPEARRHLELGAAGGLSETPKPVSELDRRVSTTIIASGRLLLEAALAILHSQGVAAEVISATLTGEARDLATQHAKLIHTARQRGGGPVVLLSGGEATVTLGANPGSGGRNHEFALALLLELGPAGIYALSAGSDGIDGSSGAAGAFLTPDSWERAQALGLDAAEALARHDSSPFFARLGDQLVTGPTGTNLNDFQAVWVGEGVSGRVYELQS